MTRRLLAEIDAMPASEDALPAAERERRLAEVEDRLLAAERAEEALVEAMIADGLSL